MMAISVKRLRQKECIIIKNKNQKLSQVQDQRWQISQKRSSLKSKSGDAKLWTKT